MTPQPSCNKIEEKSTAASSSIEHTNSKILKMMDPVAEPISNFRSRASRRLPQYVERNYSRLYAIDASPGSAEDVCYLCHTNALFILTLAPSHPVCRLLKTIREVKFQVDDGPDRAKSGGKGYRKKGAQFLSPNDVICNITCDDSTMYVVKSGIKGKLLEVNSRLATWPQLLTTHTASNGYIAIVIPNATDIEATQSSLQNEETYCRLRAAT
ncbi:hypothetical protein RvY_13682 [Ramazzottius varieornatus]|uniref:Protein Abitram n=1 Tax=Ramazzottius varieornatus TaxID=947166 RepID=A0A1D1VSS7_RAMVA|nr:hypothetical protein RvY_13682 [Ramazzottius varieornatus]